MKVTPFWRAWGDDRRVVYEVEGDPLPPPSCHEESWLSPTEHDDFLELPWNEWRRRDYLPLDPTKGGE